jgi:PKD repeat protein
VFNNLSSIKSGSCTYTWEFGDGRSNYDSNSSHSYASVDSFRVKLTTLSDYGCTDSAFQQVITFPPLADFEINDSSQCLAGNDFLFINTSQQGNVPIQYLWDFGDGDTSAVRDSLLHSYDTTGSYWVSLVARADSACADTMVKQLFVNPMPVADFSINDSRQCLATQDFQMNNLSFIQHDTIVKNTWSVGLQSFQTKDLQLSALQAGQHDVQLVVESAHGCLDTLNKTIIVDYNPKAAFSINEAEQCLNTNHFSFNNTSVIDSGILHYYWDFGDLSYDSLASPDHRFSQNASFDIKLIAKSEHNCSDSVSHSVKVFPTPHSEFMLMDSAQCLDFNYFVFINTSSVSPGQLTSYAWDLGDGYVSSDQSLNHSYAFADTFHVSLIVGSSDACFDTSTKTVIVGAMPVSKILVNDTAQCFNQQHFEFRDSSTVIGDSIVGNEWIIGNDTIRNSPSEIRNNFQASTFNLQLTTYTTQGCAHTVTRQIIVHPSPEAAFSINDSTQCLDSNDFEFSNLSVISEGVIQ